jgi:cyclase
LSNVRLIARLDLKMDFLIKGVQFEGWRKVGDPSDFARRYYQTGADELLYMDVVASLYERNNLDAIVRRAAEEIFIPITVGGGIRKLEDVKALLAVGADKVAINTAATRDPELLRRISDTYGSQATVLSIEAKRLPQGGWEAMTDNGRNHTELDPVRWAAEAQRLGAGEILVTSIDRDGTEKGMDIELVKAITREVDIPVIAAGGVGRPEHVIDALTEGGAGAVAMAKALHYGKVALPDLRDRLAAEGISVRQLEDA